MNTMDLLEKDFYPSPEIAELAEKCAELYNKLKQDQDKKKSPEEIINLCCFAGIYPHIQANLKICLRNLEKQVNNEN